MQWTRVGVALAASAVLLPVGLNAWGTWADARALSARAQRLEAVGRAALERGDPEVAERAFAQATVAVGQQPSLRNALLDARIALILREPADVDLRGALRLQVELEDALSSARATDARTRLALGRVLMFRGQLEAATREFETVAKVAAAPALAHLFLGDAFLKQGKHDLAAPALSRVLELEPTNGLAMLALGQVRLAQKRYDEAADLLGKATLSLTRNPALQFSLGRAQFHREKYAEARDALEAALSLDAGLVSAHAYLGRAYAKLNQADAAVGALKMAWEKTGDVEAYADLGRILLQVGRLEEGAQVARTLTSLRPKDPEPYMALSVVAETAGDFAAAEALVAQAEKRVEGLEDKGKWPEAVASRRGSIAQSRSAGGKTKTR
jgi:tetratricopeptide (TPR) repeat protein